ncbi:DUF7854 family protein [Haloarchaeobius litoreus]|uniref:Uncharacterized protein n=1 Tax=Haloarchaeobius litoreus TaxID=755306 RepID=A0ABD6DK70_9EURY|nr:hypothetical protein [Haloarchaeobius litoreus]
MDRISALRNVEDALASFEDGDCDLTDLERRVQTILRTYVSEFDVGESLAVYRVTPTDGGGDPPADGTSGLVLVAAGPNEARAQARELAADLPESLSVERVSD